MTDATLKSISPDGWANRIHAGKWVIRFPSGLQSGNCYNRPDGEKTQPYILATPAALAEAPEVQELIREAEALVVEWDALKVLYEDIYADAMADAESDARDFETDLWKLVRQYITELGFDWSGDASLDGVTADEALQHIRECMDGETARAERLEAALRADVKGWADNATEAWRLYREAEADRDALAARLAAAEAQVGALVKERDKYRDAFNTNCLVLRGTEERVERLEAALQAVLHTAHADDYVGWQTALEDARATLKGDDHE